MKLRTFILTVGAILALVVPAAAGATVAGAGAISNSAKPGHVTSDSRDTAKLKAHIKVLANKNKTLAAKIAALAAKNKGLAFNNTSLNGQVNSLWTQVRELDVKLNPPTPQVLNPREECVYSGNGCTPEELCTIWGYGGCDPVPPASIATAQVESNEG